MSVENLLAALVEYLEVKKDYLSGNQTEDNLTASKKIFAQSLNAVIDHRTDGVIEDRQRRISSATSIKIADVLTGSLDVVNNTSVVVALNLAPPPPMPREKSYEGFDTLESLMELEAWVTGYSDWYNVIRKKALSGQ